MKTLRSIISILVLISSFGAVSQISGPATVCGGDSETYSTTIPTSFPDFQWSVSGGSVVGSNSSSSVVISWNSSSGTGTVYLNYSQPNPYGEPIPQQKTKNVTRNYTSGGSVSSSTVCPGSSGSVSLSGHGGSVIKWQISTNGGSTWQDISNTSNSQSFSDIQTATKYRAKIDGGSCDDVWSGIGTVNIQSAPTIYTLVGGGNYCEQDGPSSWIMLGNSQINVTYTIKRDGNTVTSLSGTGSNLNFGALGTPGTYTVVATNSSGCTENMNGSVSVDEDPNTVAGSISSSSAVCGTSTEMFTLSGYTGTIEKWEIRHNDGGGWSGWNTITDTDSTVSVSQTLDQFNSGPRTYEIRAQVKSGACNALYATQQVQVDPVSVGGTISGAVEKFGIHSGSLTLGGNTGDVVKWQYKVGGTWVDITNTNDTYAYVNIQEPTEYRAIVKSGICAEAISSTALINVLDTPLVDLGVSQNLRPGQSTTISATAGHDNYEWFRNGTTIQNGNSNTLEVNAPGNYQVKVTSTGGATFTTGDAVISDQLMPNQNMVTKYLYRVPVTDASDPFDYAIDQQAISTTVYDGLGRPIQQVSMQASPLGNDLVVPIEYDEFGRQAKSYLPYVDDQLGTAHKPSALVINDYPGSDHYDYYVNESVHASNTAFAETRFEESPLNRPLEQGAPGDDWQIGGATSTFSYDIADSAEVLRWDFESLLSADEKVYNSSSLQENAITDPDGNITIEYVNFLGQTILKKSQVDGSTWAETYYIYDIYGQLAVVLPPEATDRLDAEFFGQSTQAREDFLNTWAFLYDYDGRKRMTMKKVPGADSVFMVYDQWDRLVLTQDGNQRANNHWLFTKYDQLNRPIMTGLMESQRSTTGIRNHVASQTARFDSLDASGTLQYTSHSFPSDSILNHYTVTYYDTYDFMDHTMWDTLDLDFDDPESQLTQNTAVKGQVTGTMTRVGDSSWIYSVSYYDDKYRIIQSQSTNHLGGTDVVTNYYDFIGQVDRSISTHSNGSDTTSITRSFIYDHAGRLLQTWHKLQNNADSVLIAANSYNELGELVEKSLHANSPLQGGSGGVFAQTLNYTYNIRGWLTSVNDAALTDPSDLFGMELHYNDNPLDNTREYHNGNIAAMEWSDYDGQGTGNSELAYTYDYDRLNRLTDALHYQDGASGANNPYDVRISEYDLNGNIRKLTRKDESTNNLDSLTYSYTGWGNQLRSVSDAGIDTLGFVDGNTAGDDYTYDANGNMVKDRNKGIDSIYYNHLNLPIKVEFETAGDSITYLYDAAGIKLNQVVYKAGDTLKVTDYVGEFIYETDSTGERKLQLIQHEEGRLTPLPGGAGGGFDYQYHLKDHLGNVRVTFSTEPEHYTMIESFETGEENGWQDLHPHTSTDANTTAGGDEVELLQSGQTGAMIFLSVNKRDTINLSVQANFETAPSNNNFLSTAYNTLFTSFDNVYGSGAEGGVSSTSTVFDDALSGSGMAGKDDTNTAPRAFLNYIFFDKDMNYINAGFTQITTAAQGVGVHDSVTLDIPPFDREGYVLAYLSNENQESVNVHFDDFTVYHGKTNVVSTQDYYPFGGTFNSYTRTASTAQNFKYNQGTGDKTFRTERIPELEVDMTKFRVYDYWAVRFWQVDPKADMYGQESWTPYQYAFNNPIRYNDPYGDCIPCLIPQIVAGYTGLKAKYSGIASKAEAPAQRLIAGTSGDTPSNVNLDSRTQTAMKVAGTASDINQVADTGKELATEAVKDGGEVLDKTGEVVADVGIVAAPFTEGASLALVPIGEGISATGKGMKSLGNLAQGNDQEAATEAGKMVIGLATNKLTSTAINQSKKVGTITNKTEEVTQESILGAIGSAWNKVVNYFTGDE